MDRRLAWLGLLAACSLAAPAAEALGPSTATVVPGPEQTPPREPGAALANVPAFDLLDCVTEALVHNPALGITREEIERARGQRMAANGALGPTIDFSYSEVWQQESSVTFSQGAPATTITPGNTRQFVLSSTWVLYAGGALRANQAIARLSEAAARHQLTATVNQVISETVSAYLSLLRAQEMKQVADESVALAEQQVKDTNFSFEAGAVARVDVLRAEAALQNSLQAQLQAANGIELSRAALNKQMGRSQLAPVAIEPLPISLAATPDLLASLRLAVTQRPELRAQQKAIEINEEAVRAARADYYPTVAVNSQISRTPNAGAFGSSDDFRVALAFSINLWNWQQTAGRVRSAAADLEQERLSLEQAMQNIELQVRQSVLRIEEAAKRVDVARAEVEAAREAHKIEQLRYTTQESTYLDYLDARRALTQAQSNLVAALYDYALAQADWLAATGGYVATAGEVRLPQDQTMPLPETRRERGVEFDDLLQRYDAPTAPDGGAQN